MVGVVVVAVEWVPVSLSVWVPPPQLIIFITRLLIGTHVIGCRVILEIQQLIEFMRHLLVTRRKGVAARENQ